MPKVYNYYHRNAPADAVYVMRPSKWGNPYKMTASRDRNLVVDLFREYVEASESLSKAVVEELRGKDLVCCCAPLRCHADVLLELANKEDSDALGH